MAGFMRDPSGDCNKVKTKLWESPKTKKKREFELHVLNSWFSLKSIKELPTKEDETNFMKSACIDIGTALAGIMQTEAFAECYKAAMGNDNIWKAINSDYGNYIGFVKNAKIKVEECSNFNQHLTMNDASDLVGILYDNGGKTKKHQDDNETGTDVEETGGDEDGEDSDDEEKEEKDDKEDEKEEDSDSSDSDEDEEEDSDKTGEKSDNDNDGSGDEDEFQDANEDKDKKSQNENDDAKGAGMTTRRSASAGASK